MKIDSESDQEGEAKFKSLLDNGILPFARLILAIRRELGHNNKGISELDISRLYINDIDNFLTEEHMKLNKPDSKARL